MSWHLWMGLLLISEAPSLENSWSHKKDIGVKLYSFLQPVTNGALWKDYGSALVFPNNSNFKIRRLQLPASNTFWNRKNKLFSLFQLLYTFSRKKTDSFPRSYYFNAWNFCTFKRRFKIKNEEIISVNCCQFSYSGSNM